MAAAAVTVAAILVAVTLEAAAPTMAATEATVVAGAVEAIEVIEAMVVVDGAGVDITEVTTPATTMDTPTIHITMAGKRLRSRALSGLPGSHGASFYFSSQ